MENLNFISLLLLSLIAISHASLSDNAYLSLGKSNFPSVQAEKLIRELNLFPNSEVNVIDGGDDGVSVINQAGYNKRIVERKFRFPNVVGDEEESVTVDDLGNHAGYYKIENSHDARYLILKTLDFFGLELSLGRWVLLAFVFACFGLVKVLIFG
jgi:serine carboxypeptidase-like clade 4